MILAALSAVFALLVQASFSNAFAVRDAKGDWRSPSWVKRSAPGEMISIPLTSNEDKSYSMAVRMGTPFQEIQMAISLSQNFIIVASPERSGETGFYNPSQSNSYVPTKQGSEIRTLSGGKACVDFAGEKCQIVEFSYNASVALTTPDIMGDVYPAGTRGVIGYGVDLPPEAPKDSALLNSYIPTNATIAACGIELNRVEDGVGGGLFTMGGVDESAFTGNFTTMLVPDAASMARPSWSIPVEGLFHDGQPGSMIRGGLASIDPYYPSIILPESSVARLYAGVSQANRSTTEPNRFLVPCDANIQLKFLFNGKNFSIDTRDAISKEGNGTCYGTVESGTGLYKLGSPLLRNIYTKFGAVFNPAPQPPVFSVAFAEKVQRTAPPPYATTTSAATTATGTSGAQSTPTPSSAANVLPLPVFSALLMIVSAFTLILA